MTEIPIKLVGITAIMVSIAMAFYYVSMFQARQGQTAQETCQTSSPSITVLPPAQEPTLTAVLGPVTPLEISTLVQTSGWMTYVNVAYAFQLKYPPSWHYQMVPNNPDTVLFSPDEISFPQNSEGPFSPVKLSIRHDGNIQEEVNLFKKTYQYGNPEDETFLVGGACSRRISGIVTAESYLQGRFNIEVFIPTKRDVVRLSYIEAPGVSVQLFDEMLSTFRFTNE